MGHFLRKWATPATAATFLIVGVTGVVLFFHAGGALTHWAHEWIGFAVMAVAVFHVVLNWRAATTYFKRPLAVGILAAGVIGTVVTSVNLLPQQQGGPGLNPGMVFRALEAAPIEAVAGVAGLDADTYIERLQAAGITVSSADQTAQGLAANEGDARRILALAFAR